MSHDFQEFSISTLFRFTEVGFLACDMGFPDQALAIFSALAIVQPGIPHHLMNKAIVHGRYGRLDHATKLLFSLLENFPDSQIVKAILGLLLVQQQDARALHYLDEVLNGAADKDAVAVAQSCYDLACQLRDNQTFKPALDDLQFFRHHNNRLL